METQNKNETEMNEVRSVRDDAEDAILGELREKINRVDEQLLVLLSQRGKYSLEVGGIKAKSNMPIFRPAHEKVLLDRLLSRNSGPLPDAHLLAIYKEILSSSRALQRQEQVLFLGPEGTFSHRACLEFFGEAQNCRPVMHLADIFTAVESSESAFGVVPLENSLNGSVGQSLDLFVKHQVFVQAEWFSRIRLSLISRESEMENIQVIYSHAQPFGQCSNWLRDHMPHARHVALESTSLSVRRAAEESGSAAIGHSDMAYRMGLAVLASSIEDNSDNWTRFFVIGSTPSSREHADKSSIVFALPNTPGSLANILNTFSAGGINMSKLESRPMQGALWQYMFFADLDCDILASSHAAVLQQVKNSCIYFRVLGAYPCGRHIRAGE